MVRGERYRQGTLLDITPYPEGLSGFSICTKDRINNISTNSLHKQQDHRTQHTACVHTTTLSHSRLPTQATRAISEQACQVRLEPEAPHSLRSREGSRHHTGS